MLWPGWGKWRDWIGSAILKPESRYNRWLAGCYPLLRIDIKADVGRASEVAMFCIFVQLDKAIPLLLNMRDDLKAVRENTDTIPQISEDIKAVRKTTDATLEEIIV